MSPAAEFVWIPQDKKTELFPVFENAPVGLAQCQREGNITALNPALEQMLRGRENHESSLCFADLVHPRERDESERLLAELFAGKRESFAIESEGPGSDARRVRWTVWRVPGVNGNVNYALALAESAAGNHEAEHHHLQAERFEAVGRLAGGVAHDFNNLLTGVLLYCDLLMASLETSHRARKYAEEIRNAGMQATALVRQLLTVARSPKSEPRLLSLNDIAEGMRNLLVRLIGENVELDFHLDPNLGLIRMDPTQSQQILLNLVLNARDAMPGGGQVTIETHNCRIQLLSDQSDEANTRALLPCALFVVADNGSGMNAATRDHLFEAFFTTKDGKGTGLGLATVHDIVTSHGGLIHVDSTLGQGTRISVLLPLAPETLPHSEPSNDFHGKSTWGKFSSKEEE